ncbi:MAG: DUF6765 family protein [Nitrospinota bacterium]
MDHEFHYYITYILAKRAGFSYADSYTIAYSSQYVDDNCLIFTINEGKSDEYKNHISQTMNILKPKSKLMRIYPCFHFVPGEYESGSARRKDGKMHILNTTPNSKNANILMDNALSTGDLYRIGVNTHCYADTWAHQNFVGYFDYFNGMGGLFEKITPDIGHADAQHLPDIPGLVWEDERLVSRNKEVNNTKRIIEAAENIFKKYKSYLNRNADNKEICEEWEKLKEDIENAIGRNFYGKDKERKHRVTRYKELLKDFKEYDEDDWFEEAVNREVVGLPDNYHEGFLSALKIFSDKYHKKTGFENSHWFKFQEAVKGHQELAEELYAGLFRQMEVEEY